MLMLAHECQPERGTPLSRSGFCLALAGGRGLAGVARAIIEIFFPPAWIRIGCSATRNRIRRASLVTHLRREPADAMLVQKVSQLTHRYLQKIRSVSLIAVGSTKRFQDVRLLQLVQMRGQVDAFARQF